MNFTARPSPNPEVVLREDFDDYHLLYQPLFADVAGLSPVGLAVWRALDGQRTIEEVAAEVRERFEGATESLIEDVRAFLADLTRRGFIAQEETSSQAPANSRSVAPVNPGIQRNEAIRNARFPEFHLSLADGSHFVFQATDQEAARVVDQFAISARLPSVAPTSTTVSVGAREDGSEHRLFVMTDVGAVQESREGSGVCVIQSIASSRTPRVKGGAWIVCRQAP